MKTLATYLAVAFVVSTMSPSVLHAQSAAPADQGAAAKSAKVLPLTAEDKADMFAIAAAMQVAEKCAGLFALDSKKTEGAFLEIEQRLAKQGFKDITDAQMERAMPNHEVRRKILSFARQRNLRNHSASSWCPVGDAEIAQKTLIGSYLIRK